jgi:Glycosyltransferase
LRPAAATAGVRLSGFQTHDAVLAAMARASIVVVPSRWAEPFGLVALEAMACGAALVCSMRGGLAELVGDAAEPCDPDDPAALAETLFALASSTEARATLAARGLARARCFDTPLVAEALDGWRARVLAGTMKET